MTLPEKLLYYRKEAGLSQLELAERLDVSQQAVSRWESGAAVPSIENLKFLSGLYGVSVDFLLDDGAEPGEEEKRTQAGDEKNKGRQSVPVSWRRDILLILVALVIGFLIGACVIAFSKNSTPPIKSLDDLEASTIDPDTEQIFSFE